MPVGLPLDFDVLLKPLPGDAPAGDSGVFYEIRPTLEELRREVTPATRTHEEEELKSADWLGVEKLTREVLSGRAKDVRVAGYLVEALVKKYRFEGLAAGLELVHRMFAECWDFLLPAVEDGDVSGRAQPVDNMLDAAVEARKGVRLPLAVRSVALVCTDGKDPVALSQQDWALATGTDPFQKKERE